MEKTIRVERGRSSALRGIAIPPSSVASISPSPVASIPPTPVGIEEKKSVKRLKQFDKIR